MLELKKEIDNVLSIVREDYPFNAMFKRPDEIIKYLIETRTKLELLTPEQKIEELPENIAQELSILDFFFKMLIKNHQNMEQHELYRYNIFLLEKRILDIENVLADVLYFIKQGISEKELIEEITNICNTPIISYDSFSKILPFELSKYNKPSYSNELFDELIEEIEIIKMPLNQYDNFESREEIVENLFKYTELEYSKNASVSKEIKERIQKMAEVLKQIDKQSYVTMLETQKISYLNLVMAKRIFELENIFEKIKTLSL